MMMVTILTLTACGGNSSGSKDRVVNVCSWGEYIDESLIDQFEEETGIKVNYQTAESNEALYSLLKTGAGDYDVIVPSDYMIGRLIAEDMLAELNYDNIPNYAKIDDRYKNLSYDPDNKYTVPYTWGTLGIIYNTTMVDEEITSWTWAMISTPPTRPRFRRPMSCCPPPRTTACIRPLSWTRSSRRWKVGMPPSPCTTPAIT